MFAKAKDESTDRIKVVTEFDDFLDGLEKKCLLQAPFCGDKEFEEVIKDPSKKDSNLELWTIIPIFTLLRDSSVSRCWEWTVGHIKNLMNKLGLGWGQP